MLLGVYSNILFKRHFVSVVSLTQYTPMSGIRRIQSYFSQTLSFISSFWWRFQFLPSKKIKRPPLSLGSINFFFAISSFYPWLLSFFKRESCTCFICFFTSYFLLTSLIWLLVPPHFWNSSGKFHWLPTCQTHWFLFRPHLLNLYHRRISPQTLVLGVKCHNSFSCVFWSFCFGHLCLFFFLSSVLY